ncbi:molybdenum cofactor sulfurylase [Bacillus sp. 491mf]|uniref:XdhC family protein n=1 Tax=Bacillus sp. 491mf TaxID=1761755 RepID=UPI0008EF3958|nr:XdhC family protein [Bacillus sp. 491mf]SFD61008.1 molybdenum cofactor sulfurylase [Bacillus sp. 491mf]
MTSVYDVLEALLCCEKRCALATIIHVEGSAYRKEGTMMLFREDGTKVGMLSAGCIEEELFYYAADVMEHKTWAIHTFNTKAEDDLSWGVGCNGVIHVLVEHIDDNCKAILQDLYIHLTGSSSAWMVKDLSLEKTAIIYDNRNWEGAISKETDLKNGLQDEYYSQLFIPKPRLFIFGAGEDAKPLVRFAKETSFFVTICDWREGLCNTEQFPNADECVVGFPVEMIQKLSLHPSDFLVIMTHHFEKDRQLLSLLLEKSVRYIGVLGPRHRTERLLEGKAIPHHLHFPVGISIGAQGPGEISISIMAEIIGKLRGK